MKKIPQIRSIDELHGEEKAIVFGPFKVSAIHYVLVPQLAQGPHFTAKAGGEGLVAGPLTGEKLEELKAVMIYPAKQFVAPAEKLRPALLAICRRGSRECRPNARPEESARARSTS